MGHEESKPKWAIEASKLVDEARPKITFIRQGGLAEVRRGLEKAHQADMWEGDLNFVGYVLDQEHPRSSWEDEVITITGRYLPERLDAFNRQLDGVIASIGPAGEASETAHATFVRATYDSDGSSGSTVYIGAAMSSRFNVIEPGNVHLVKFDDVRRLADREGLSSELESLIAECCPAHSDEFIEMLRGSEAALGSDSPDSLSQASHSMRDLFEQVLRACAPSEALASQPWFGLTNGPLDGVSRRSRIRYMLYGSGEGIDQSALDEMDRVADGAKTYLDLCQHRAHSRDLELSPQEVQISLDQARNALRHLLRAYRAREHRSGVTF